MSELDVNKENMVEFLSGEHFCTVTFTNRKHINKIKRLYEERKSEFKYFHENKDGSVVAKLPLKWIKVNAGALPGTSKKREMTDEQKAAFVARVQAAKKNKK